MKIEEKHGEDYIAFLIRDIQGDMGEDLMLGEEVKMTLLQQADGDVIIALFTSKARLSIEFCSESGGGRYPIIARKLRELISELVKAPDGRSG